MTAHPAEVEPAVATRAQVEQVWAAVTRLVAEVSRAVDLQIMAAHGLRSVDVDVLAEVDREPRRRATMTGLGLATGLSASGTTRVVDRLVDLGWLCRERDGTRDRRLYWVRLTSAGRERLERAAPVRAELLGRQLDSRLDQATRAALCHLGDRPVTDP